MRKIFYSLAIALVALMVSIPAQADNYYIHSHEQLRSALRTGMIDALDAGEYGLSKNDVLILQNDIVWNQDTSSGANLNRDLLFVVERAVSQYNIDLNGHIIQRNILKPVGDDAVSVFSFKERESVNPVTLTISDSKGGGKVIANTTTMITGGNYPTAVLFPSTCPGPCELYVSGGSLIGQVMGCNFAGAAGVTDNYGCKTTVSGGFLTAYTSNVAANGSTLNLHGGVIGDTYNIGAGAQSAVFMQGGLSAQSTWSGGTVFGVSGANSNFFSSRIASSSNVYLNGAASSAAALDALSNENKKKAKIEIEKVFDLTVNNKQVTSLNAEDVLGDGKVKFYAENNNLISGILYLTGATITNITNYIPDLVICISGTNTLNGQLLSYGGNVTVKTIDERLNGTSASHTLKVTCASETPIQIYDANFCVKTGAGITIDGKNNKNAVECKVFDINYCWFEATVTGAGPVVNGTSNDISNCKLVSGSLTGKSVKYTPNIISLNYYVLGHEITQFDVLEPLTGEGISGKVECLSSGVTLTNAIIDARGMNVEALKGSLQRIYYSGTCFIISDNKAAIELSGISTTSIRPSGSGENHLYIISDTYGINASNVNLEFGAYQEWDPVTIYGGSYGIYGNNEKPEVTINGDLDISCGAFGLPMYKVALNTNSTRTSDFGGSFDATEGVFTKADGKDADHVTFRRTLTTQSGTAYPIEVEGVSITAGNASDVLEDGKVSYNASTNTLTLNDANIEGWYTPGIRVTDGGLNIALVGSSSVQSSNPYGAIYSVNGDLNINGKQNDSLFVYGRGMMGLNRMTTNYRTAITGGGYVSAICRDDNFMKSYRSAAMQSDSLYVNKSTLYVENKSANPVNKVALYSYNANSEPGLLLVDAEIIKGEPNTPDPLLIAPTSGQAIENIQVEGDQPQKIMMDGILYIVREGKIYNAQGANVK
ncbi:MAG: hypothetical protein IJ955_08140 [Oscillospiraceae bacterium]|nr:hypothetical protein [Oscillospiraceae bacterium]